MQEYNDETLIKKIGWDKMPEAERKRKLSVTKSYLYHQILRSLRTYNEKESIETQLHNMILDVENLKSKGLYSAASKRIAQAKKIATEHEKLPTLLDILTTEINLSIGSKNRQIKSTVKDLYDEANKVLSKLEEVLPIQQLDSETFVAIRTRTKEAESDLLEKVEELLPEEKFVLTLKSFYAVNYYYHTLASYYQIKQDFKKAHDYRLKIVELWRDKTKIKNARLTKYIIILSNFLQSCHELDERHKYSIFPEIFKEIAELPIRSQAQEVEVFQNVYFLKLLWYFNTNKFHKAEALVPEIESGLTKYDKEIKKARLITFYHNLTLLFFILADYENAWKWLSKILNDDKSDVMMHIQRFSRIFEIVIHLELDSDRVVNYLLETLKTSKKNEFEQLAFKYLDKINKAVTMKRSLYRDFKIGLDNLDNPEKYTGINELAIWVETKITNRTFIEILRDKDN